MRCPRCRYDNRAGAAFCEECGGSLQTRCPRCGEPRRPHAKFCGKCGERLDAAAAGPDDKYASPASYTPKHLAELIVTSRRALEGERKQVTILFADLKGSMELLADRDPEEAGRLLEPVLDRMMDAVHRYEGTVNQVMGDGIMAIFGAPVAHEDHALRACYAALEMQAAIRRHADALGPRYDVPIQIRVGLNSGEVVVGTIGSDLRMEYTAVGRTTHIAARMEQLAEPGTIVLPSETLRLAEAYLIVSPRGPVAVKGLDAPLAVYELTGATPVRSRFGAAAARGLTRFVGRERELAQVHDALGRAEAGQGQAIGVVGEAGIGKSRLAWEVARARRAQGWLVLQAGAVSYEKGTPYRPVVDLLRGYFHVEDRDDGGKIREKLEGKLAVLDAALGISPEPLLTLLDVSGDDEARWRTLEPVERRQRTLEAVGRLFLHESRVQPVLLVLEDLHWLDSETQAVLDTLVGHLSSSRMAVLTTYRPEYEPRWGDTTGFVRVRLDPLPRRSVDEILDALLGTDASVRALAPVLVERTGGNPFFIEESVRTLVETDVLHGERGAYRLTRPVGTIQVPATVQAVLAARLDRLDAGDKRLLQEAAVIGKDVPFALLAVLSGRPADELRARLARLQAAEFVYEARLFPEPEYTFKHALTHDVAYEGLLQQQRRALHARVVDALEGGGDGSRRQVEQLAHHALRGERWEQAVRYAREAGSKAARGAGREAVTYFRQALLALGHLPEDRRTTEQAIDLWFYLGGAFVVLADLPHASECLAEAERLAATLRDHRRFARVSALITQCSWLSGDLGRAIDSGRRALETAEEVADFPLQVRTNLFLGWTYHLRGDYERALACLRRTIGMLQGDLSRATFGVHVLPAVGARAGLAWCLSELGAFGEALAVGEEAMALAASVEHGVSGNPNVVFAHFATATAHLFRGGVEQAIPLLEQALEVCRRVEVWFLVPLITAHVGRAYALAGRLGDALPLLQEAVDGSRHGVKAGEALWTAWLSECYLDLDRRDEAVDAAEQALALCRATEAVGHEAWVHRLLGEIAARGAHADVAAAERHYRHALARATALGMRPLAAHCHLAIARLLDRAGASDEAAEARQTAVSMYRAMQMECPTPP